MHTELNKANTTDNAYADNTNPDVAVVVLRSLADRIEMGELAIDTGGLLLETFPFVNTVGLSANVRFKVK